MARYYVNRSAQKNGDHEVHKEGCYWLSLIASKKDLNLHSNCKTAVAEAKKTYPQSNGCKTCSVECHTS
ncbi:hypothetical protein [Flavimarina sp. Hel_I_48]|uniref:hypothetical protein n=1 Tax=Flavimarina sp. Hel_I_48 TaxID=1392488 RepID=UPI0004DFAFAC|nr:hypothetical protein [Flavimarina sp. Hel_I_48]